MNCHDAQELITPFIEDRLSDQELADFLEHILSCSDCYDELEVYYVLLIGLKQLDENHIGILDFKKNLQAKINEKKSYLRRKHNRRIRKKCIAVLLVILLAAAAVFMLKVYESGRESIHSVGDLNRSIYREVRDRIYGTDSNVPVVEKNTHELPEDTLFPGYIPIHGKLEKVYVNIFDIGWRAGD